MSSVYPICEAEHRELDGFDLICILGLMKEYNGRRFGGDTCRRD